MSDKEYRFSPAARLDEMFFSPIRVMLDKVREAGERGVKVVPLVAGEPDFNTPQEIKDATARALAANFTHYGSNRGQPKLRRAIARLLEKDTGIAYDPETELLVTCGGAEAINNAILATVNPDDEIILFTPVFVSYENLLRMCGAKVVELPLRGENGFQPDMEEVRRSITTKTRMMILNSPNNPTGVVFTRELLGDLARLACEHNLLVFSDEIYSTLTYGGTQFCSIASFPGMRERTIMMNGFSKAYAMTGWRLGYIAAEKSILSAILKVHQYSTTCAPTFIQEGLAEAMENKGTLAAVGEMKETFAQRRALLLRGLDSIPRLRYTRPDGAFYVFVDVSQTGLSGDAFAARLFDEKQVATVPGSGFGKGCESYVRLSFATGEQNITEGLKRIAEFTAAL